MQWNGWISQHTLNVGIKCRGLVPKLSPPIMIFDPVSLRLDSPKNILTVLNPSQPVQLGLSPTGRPTVASRGGCCRQTGFNLQIADWTRIFRLSCVSYLTHSSLVCLVSTKLHKINFIASSREQYYLVCSCFCGMTGKRYCCPHDTCIFVSVLVHNMVVCRMPFLPNPTTCGHRLNSQRLLGCGRALNDGVSMVEEVQVGEMVMCWWWLMYQLSTLPPFLRLGDVTILNKFHCKCQEKI